MVMLTCDICDGKLVIGSGGIAGCDFCGMEYTKDRIKEKIQENKGVINNRDNFKEIENYFVMAKHAYESGNKEEAEIYCNKIIELEISRYDAWLMKGKVAGWKTTITNNKFNEAINCFSKALEFVAKEEKENLKEEIKEELRELSLALIVLQGERFNKFPDNEESSGFINNISIIIEAIIILNVKTDIEIYDMLDEIATKVNEMVVTTWRTKILPDYNGREGRPGEHEWRNFIKQIGYCTSIIKRIVGLSGENNIVDIVRYENLLFFEKQAIDSCSWDYYFTEWGTKKWRRQYTLSEEAKDLRREKILNCKDKLSILNEKKEEEEEIKKEEKARIAKEMADKRYDEYWNKNSEERIRLESRKNELKINIGRLESKIQNIVDQSEKANVQNKINKLIAEKKCIGIFKIKEKNLILKQIIALQEELNDINNELEKRISPIQMEVDKLEEEKKEIEIELTKER